MKVENPLWFNFVLRAVGLCGRGDEGVARGDLSGASGTTGDFKFRESAGRPAGVGAEVATLRESFGLRALEVIILAIV